MHQEFGVRKCLSYITTDQPMDLKPKTKGGKKPTLSNKQIIAKYQALYKML